MSEKRIYLSPPNVGDHEMTELSKVLQSGWIAPVGPAMDAFENQLSLIVNREVLVLNSGTSALHLALILSGVGDGDHVLVGTHTFAACANVVLYERAIPILIDSESKTWNIDPDLMEEYLSNSSKIPKALIVTHIYGMPAQMERISEICERYDIVVIEDAAESLGSLIGEKHAGTFGDYGITSFNGNKIITTSGGGALICSKEAKQRALHLATQANVGEFGYDHLEAGYNYRMSNVLAGLGLGQLRKLNQFVEKKRQIFEIYKQKLNGSIEFLEEPAGCFSNRWLSVGLLTDRSKEVIQLISFLDSEGIEARRFWKPLHLHKAYSAAKFIGNGVSEGLFNHGICLPSGTGLTDSEQSYVIDKIKNWFDQ